MGVEGHCWKFWHYGGLGGTIRLVCRWLEAQEEGSHSPAVGHGLVVENHCPRLNGQLNCEVLLNDICQVSDGLFKYTNKCLYKDLPVYGLL